MSDTKARPLAADQQDERLMVAEGPREALQAARRKLKSGDVGVIPVVVGIVIIAVIMQTLNSNFLSSANLVNLTMQSVPVGIIALGIVCVLLVGNIDLSVGSVSGLTAAVTAVLFVRQELPAIVAVGAAILTGVAIGLLYGYVCNRFGVPSFVASLAGLLGFQGLMLYLLGPGGAINLPFDSVLVQFGQALFLPAWASYALVVVASLATLGAGLAHRKTREEAGLSTRSVSFLVIRSAVMLVGLGGAVWYLNLARGVGYMFVLFVVLVVAVNYVLTRTRWGRSFYAVGGNVEAARRAGINVRRVYTSAFVMCSSLAALGGVLAASRLASANQSSGTGGVELNAIAAAVIGGTSLFGGRGSAYSALFGIIVIQAIANGLVLLNLDSSIRFIVTGAVLLLAVIVDSIARRSQRTPGGT